MSDDPPTKLAKFTDVFAPETPDEKALDPMTIVALVFERPVNLDRSVVLEKPVPTDKPLDLDVTHYGLGLINKVTPELLLAVVANIIATSPTAAAAVARLRLEIAGWKFEDAAGNIR